MTKKIIPYILFSAAALFLFFFQLPQIPLWSSDEGRFAEIARAMHVTGNWIVPHFNGLPYLEKPPLAAWTTLLSYKAFGITAFATRLPGALSALGVLFLAFLFIRRFFGNGAAQYATLCLLTTAGFVLVGRFAVIDMQMIFLLSSSLFFLMLGVFEQKNRFYLIAGVFMGLTFLTKGLIGAALPAIIFFIFLALTGRFNEFKKLPVLILTFLIFIGISIPWTLAILKQQPEFLDIFIFEHHFKRFATATFGRKRPFWFFTYILPLVTFPWCLFLPAAIADAWKSAKEYKQKCLFLLLWAAIIFIFFSIPRSKLPYYIVPTTVPLALLSGVFLSRWVSGEKLNISGAWLEWTWKITCAIFILGATGLYISLLFANRIPEIGVLRPWIPIGALMLAVGGVESFYFFKKNNRKAAILTIAVSVYLALIVVFFCMIRLSPLQSTADFASIIQENSNSEDMIAAYGSPDRYSDLPFHLKRRIVIVGSDRGTMTRESRQEENKSLTEGWFFELSEFATVMQKSTPQRIFCLMESDRLKELQNLGLKDFRIWMESHGRILISNH